MKIDKVLCTIDNKAREVKSVGVELLKRQKEINDKANGILDKIDTFQSTDLTTRVKDIALRVGTCTERPTDVKIGRVYYDTTYKEPVFDIGKGYVNVDGELVPPAEQKIYTSDTGTITVNNSFNGDIKDIVIKGKSVVQSDTITSVGEAEGNKIALKSVGKNLFNLDISKFEKEVDITISKIDNGFIIKSTKNLSWKGASIWLNLKPNVEYTLKSTPTIRSGEILMSVRDGENKPIQGTIEGKLSNDYTLKFTPNQSGRCKIIFFGVIGTSMLVDIDFKNIQLEQGTIATDYELFVEDKKEVQLPFEGGLKGLETVQDELKYSENKIIQRIGKRAYKVGDEDDTSVLTDKTNTLYVLDTPIIHNLNQIVPLKQQRSDVSHLIVESSVAPSLLQAKMLTLPTREFAKPIDFRELVEYKIKEIENMAIGIGTCDLEKKRNLTEAICILTGAMNDVIEDYNEIGKVNEVIINRYNEIDRLAEFYFNEGFNIKVEEVVFKSGLTRPKTPVEAEYFFDLNIMKPIWYDGNKWRDGKGIEV